MDPVAGLKRAAPVTFEMCIICQETKLDLLFQATPNGMKSVFEATLARQKFHDHTN